LLLAPLADAVVHSSFAGGRLAVVTDAGDSVAITCSGGFVKVNGADSTPAAQCTAVTQIDVTGDTLGNTVDLRAVTATAFPSLWWIQVVANEGADTVYGTDLRDILRGGAGDDSLIGGDGDDQLEGDGDDDNLDGGPGNDILNGRAGADDVAGGSGPFDTVSYEEATGPTEITLDDLPGDGMAGENDNIRSDVERVGGGPWTDHIVGNLGENQIGGGAGGADHLEGKGGDDRLYSSSDQGSLDTLDGGEGGDELIRDDSPVVFIGGPGWDLADLTSVQDSMLITLDGVADDGPDGTDNVGPDVEVVASGSGDDVLVGSDDPNILEGRGGDDVLVGLLGADDFYGGEGFDLVSYADRSAGVDARLGGVAGSGVPGEDDWIAPDIEDLEGGFGNDRLVGDAEENFIFGGAGDDTIEPLGSMDFVSAGDGSDTAAVRDGLADQVTCGTEIDAVVADSEDDVDPSCETVDRPGAPPPPPPPPPPLPPPPPPPPPSPVPPQRPPTLARCVVPQLKGRTVAQARRVLRGKRCSLGRVRRVFSRTRSGRIIAQSTRPGARLPRGARVNVVVSRGRRR
jgi:hypothetical protein